MQLKIKMRTIARLTRKIVANDLNKLKKHAENITKEHELATEKAHEYAHKYAVKLGHVADDGNERHKKSYDEAHAHYMQHELHRSHPELHEKLKKLSDEAPKARLAYKRAQRSQT
jgi:hypothetical protein